MTFPGSPQMNPTNLGPALQFAKQGATEASTCRRHVACDHIPVTHSYQAEVTQ